MTPQPDMRVEFGRLMEFMAEQLDVSPSKYRDAAERYEAVGGWLDQPDSKLHQYGVDIYPQGSFALGTVIRPIGDDEYDIDAVCRLNNAPAGITQQNLKEMVGDRLRAHGKYRDMLDPKNGSRRCWRIQYSDGAKFHLDLLPAVPDNPNWLVRLGVPINLAQHAIEITDSATWDLSPTWSKSNPMGYVLWFKNRTGNLLLEGKKKLAFERQMGLDEIPDYEVRTPLQRVIQILKRHRDVRYAEDDDRPISIIIATLAATVYENERTVGESLLAIIPKMQAELLRQRSGTEWWVANPVNPAENFADKWKNTPKKAQVFVEWLRSLEQEHRELVSTSGFQTMAEYLTESYGAREASSALMQYEASLAVKSLVRGVRPALLVESVNELTKFDLPQRVPPPWPMAIRSIVTVSGQWRKSSDWKSISSNGLHVLRGGKLRFTAKTDASGTYDVFWQIVNTGRDARKKSGLRGTFERPRSDASSPLIRDESTEYRGRHWIQCFIVQNEVCIGRSAEFVVNIV